MMNDYVLLIKNRLSISEIVRSKVQLTLKGNLLWGLCPFHNEKTPSFKVDDNKGTYHCFGCGKHGDIFSFLQEIENWTFKQALDSLAITAGVEIHKSFYQESRKDSPDYIISILKEANDFFVNELLNSKDALKYVEKRFVDIGFNYIEVCKKYQIGFAPNNNKLITMLKAKYSDDMIVKAGLISNKGFMYFKNRITFPIKDTKSNIIAFGGRIINSFNNEAKYLNSPETIVFKKSYVLYGYDKICGVSYSNNIYNSILLVEGYIDTITLQMAGVKAVGLLGTAITIKHLETLRKFAKITICFDGDDAGLNAFKRSIQLILREDPNLSLKIKIVLLPHNRDPYDLYKDNKSYLSKLLKNTLSVTEAIWEYYMRDFKLQSLINSNAPEDHAMLLLSLKSDFLDIINRTKNSDIGTIYKSFFKSKLFYNNYNKQSHNMNLIPVLSEETTELRWIMCCVIMEPNILLSDNRDEKFGCLLFKTECFNSLQQYVLKFISNGKYDENNIKEKLLEYLRNIYNDNLKELLHKIHSVRDKGFTLINIMETKKYFDKQISIVELRNIKFSNQFTLLDFNEAHKKIIEE